MEAHGYTHQITKTFSHGLRIARVFLTAAPIVLSLIRDWRRYISFGPRRILSQPQHLQRAKHIRHSLESLGLVFIKLGQVISSRGDLLPKIYIDELSKLQDSIRPIEDRIVRKLLEAEYHRPIEQIFDEFVFLPLATGSIGQVHKARYKGKQVVVKFRRPNIRQQLTQDSQIALYLLEWVVRLCRSLKLSELAAVASIYRQAVREISLGMMEETDLEQERKNLELLLETSKDIKDLVIPQVISELCRPNVLVLKYLQGTKVSDIQALAKQGHDFAEVMNRIVSVYMQMILIKGVYHADPHPGNIAVLDDGKILLYDFGIVRRLSQTTRESLFRLVLAAIRKDLNSVIDELYRIGIIQPQADRTKVLEVANKFINSHFKGLPSRERIREIAETIYNNFRGFPLHLPQELVYVFRCLSLIEGLGTRYRPGWNFLADGHQGIRSALINYLTTEHTFWSLLGNLLQGVLAKLKNFHF
ncbi:MAG: AarF/UbiB family protein [Acidobacteriota bacterium]|nr:AarF/UbiB family protein [Blastocatellia bacterium]MDW8412055.1 AarF/UbiB family protein [Acidobacteriota bacterium]